MRSMAVAVLLAAFLSVTGAFAAEKVIVYCDDGYPPYSWGESDAAKGVYVDILREAFGRMKEYEVEIKPVPWKRLLAMIENGDGFAGFPPYASKNRPWMTLSEPILQEKIVVFGKKSKLEGKAVWPDDFFGAAIGLNAGFDRAAMLGEAGFAAEKEGKIRVEEGRDSESNLKKLTADRIDFYLNDQLTDISAHGAGDDPIVVGPEVVGQWGHLGFTQKLEKYPFGQKFIDELNAVIKEMKDSGRIDEIVDSYKKK